jgi:hypothetical protein
VTPGHLLWLFDITPASGSVRTHGFTLTLTLTPVDETLHTHPDSTPNSSAGLHRSASITQSSIGHYLTRAPSLSLFHTKLLSFSYLFQSSSVRFYFSSPSVPQGVNAAAAVDLLPPAAASANFLSPVLSGDAANGQQDAAQH